MKKILLLLSIVLFSATVMAQVSGGHVVRKPKKTFSAKQQPLRNTKQQSTTNMSASQKSAILQRLVDNMVYVQGGTFTMGGIDPECLNFGYQEETHQVTLSNYFIGKYEVTQEEWQAVMGNNPSIFKGAKRPVENVSWDDCQTFIRKLNNVTGKNFRLPTEAEWEYAARGGNRSNGFKYSGSNNLGNVAWYNANSGSRTHDVGQKLPNELGLYDMSGNVEEWCSDIEGFYTKIDKYGNKEDLRGRVVRGGSIFDKNGSDREKKCLVFFRAFNLPDWVSSKIGLRLALSQ